MEVQRERTAEDRPDQLVPQTDGPEESHSNASDRQVLWNRERRLSCTAASESTLSESGATSSSDAEDEDTPVAELGKGGWLAQARLSQRMNGLGLPAIEPPSFGEVHVENSTNVHLGNRTFYKGPVTIRQVVYANSTSLTAGKSEPEATQETPAPGTGSNGVGGAPTGFHGRPECGKELFWKYRYTLMVTTIAATLVLITIISISLSDPTISGVRVVTRVEWAAQPPVRPPKALIVPAAIYVIISHTATTYCYTQAQCVLNVRVAQTFHIESRGWDDISYNFLVGGDGLAYEGRGWDVEGAHTFNYNNRSIGISFIGTFNSVEPTPAQLHAARQLIQLGLGQGKIDPDYKLLGHRQCIKTESPGEVLYNIIKTWDHWSPKP